jgi:uncharacterized protein YndB with AHSA1/START domain
MHGPDGVDYPNRVVFDEIVEPERIVYTHGTSEQDPDLFKTSVTFEDQHGKTLITLRAVFRTAEERNINVEKYGAVEGGKQTLGRLDEYVRKM